MNLVILTHLKCSANCGKAQLGIYDGYEHTLDGGDALKKYCGDLRYYKGMSCVVSMSQLQLNKTMF
jgi:hypothetical protein